MKSYIFLFAVLFIAFFNIRSYSQEALKAGVYTLSGGISYSSTNSSYSTTNTEVEDELIDVGISPSFGYFVVDNLFIGGTLSFHYTESESKYTFTRPFPDVNSFKIVRRQLGIGPEIRYYIPGLNVHPFVEAGYTYSTVLSTDQNGSTFNAAAGVNFFISNSTAIEPYISYLIGTYSEPDRDVNTFSIGVRMAYFIVN